MAIIATGEPMATNVVEQDEPVEEAPARQGQGSSGVRSQPIRSSGGRAWHAGLLAWAFALPLWLIGARFTLDGWVVALNAVAGWLTLPAVIPHPSGWWVLLCAPLGVAYSWVELAGRPGRLRRATVSRWSVLALLWVAVMLTDIGSTALGLLYPGDDAWPLFTWLAQVPPGVAVVAILLTFLPEALAVGGWRLINGW